MRKIEFFGSAREFKKHQKEFLTRIKKAISGGQYLQGKDVQEFEEAIAKMTNRRHGIAVNSCTDALYFSLVAAGVKPGDHVMVTDFSFIASASCILRLGAVPVFVDIDDNYLMNFADAERLLTKRVKALVMVHLYGQMANPLVVENFCQKHGLVLIEDAAQAIGAQWKNRKAGSLGAASCISFDPTKPISAPGSGGVVVTNDDALADRVRRLRYHGRSSDKIHFEELGFNCQMPSLTAAVLNFKLKMNAKWLRRRRDIAAAYIKGLSHINAIDLPREISSNSHIYHKFVIRHPQRDELKRTLAKKGVETMVHYNIPLHAQPCFKTSNSKDADFPKANAFSKTVLSLPIYPQLTDRDVKRVVDLITDFHS